MHRFRRPFLGRTTSKGRNQGMHTEEEQGEVNVALLENIHREGYDGAILFS